jgi:DNA-binding transcriptional MerR regulator
MGAVTTPSDAPAKATPEATDTRTADAAAGPGGRTWTIAEVAEQFGVTHRTVRHYEDLGLISPERRGTTRVYHRRDRTRLNLILRGKRLGFPLEEIRTIIDMYDEQPGEAGQLTYLLGQIGERRAELERRRKDIEDSLAELADLERRCEADLRARG